MRNLRFIVTLGLLAPLALPQQPASPPGEAGAQLISELKVAVSSLDRQAIPSGAIPSAALQSGAIQSGAIGTIAGNGDYGFSDGTGQAVTAQIDTAYAVGADSRGTVYVADTLNHRIRKVGADGTIATIAGTGQEGFSGDNGPGSNAMIAFPRGLATDLRGNLYIADSGNFRVRRLAPDGTITTFAGSGIDGFSGDGGPATLAQMRMPRGLATDSAGNVYIADSWNYRIRRVDLNGVIQTIAGTGENGYSGDGGRAAVAALGFVQALAVDSSLNIYVSDALNHVVRRINAAGIIQTVAGNGSGGWAGDGGNAAAAQLNYPRGLALDPPGNLYVADSANNRIRQVSTSGTIKTVAGTGEAGFGGDSQSALSAKLNYPYGLAGNSGGNIYVGDLRNYRIRQANLSAALPLSITTTTTLPQGAVGVSYSYTLVAAGGSPPDTWSLSSGALPSGLSLSSAGTITGTPTTIGNSTFAVRVTDGSSANATQTFSLTIASVFTITTDPVLLSGFVGGAYSQTLSAAGGNPPYTWASSGALPPGLTLSASGTITGTPTVAGGYAFTIRVTDSASATATKASTLTVMASSSLVRAGAFAHLASGGGWKTTITLVNLSSSPVPARILFHADDGTALTLPLTVSQQRASQVVTASSLDRVINPNATLLIDTEAPQTSALLTGWADVLTSGPVNGFAIFREGSSNGTASEGTVPLQNQFQSTTILPYDNTGGFVMGVAIANLGASSSSITATIWDDSGSQLGAQPIAIPANGHAAFVLPDKLPLTIGKRGVVVFQSAGGSGMTYLGLRFSPFGTFTSVPIIPGQ
jgi:sugar lactone lactonase YvrE